MRFGLVIFFGLLLFFSRPVFAECDDLTPEKRVECFQNKVSEKQGQARTLSGEIGAINNQISLTKSQIDLTEQKIDRIGESIASVSGKIDTIQESLEKTSDVLAKRIAETYKIGQSDPVFYLFSAADFADFWRRVGYLQIVQKHDKALLYQMATIKKNYNDQKNLLEVGKKQKELLAKQLLAYKSDLDRQNESKRLLLEVTHNDESRYQRLLSEARAQLAAFQGFVSLRGGGLLSNQTKCDDWGCYYNQRDNKWGTMALNHTGYTLEDSGCLVTSMAMVVSHYGHKDVTPISINDNSSNFAVYFPAYLNKSINVGGKNWVREGISRSEMDSELSAGRPVVVGIGYGPSHFVVIVSGSNGNYKMNDPYVENGKDIAFDSKYSLSSISEIDKVY